MRRVESKLGWHLAVAACAAVLSLGLALAAAHYYEVPTLSGRPTHSAWLERDTLFSLASSCVALSSAVWTRRSATSPGALAAGSLALRVLLWAGLSVWFLAAWASSLSLLSLLVAPCQALATLRLLSLLTRWY